MFESLSAYWHYLRYPRLLPLNKDKKMLWQDMFWLFVLDLAFTAIIGLIYYTLLHFKLIQEYEGFDLFQYGFPLAMLLGVIFAPLSEELLFRWQLRSPKASIWFVLISAAIVVATFIKNDYLLFFICIGFFLIGLVVITILDKLKRLRKVHAFRAYYIFLFYYTAFIFGYVHISNIKGLTLADPSFILYISSQIFGGLSMGYLRVKYGLKYSILLHAVFNALMVPLAWLMTWL